MLFWPLYEYIWSSLPFNLFRFCSFLSHLFVKVTILSLACDSPGSLSPPCVLVLGQPASSLPISHCTLPVLSHAHLLCFTFSGGTPAATFLFSKPYGICQACLPDPLLYPVARRTGWESPNSKLLFYSELCPPLLLFDL